MSKRKSDWYVPPDWILILFPIPCIAVLAALLLPVVAQLKSGDLWGVYALGVGAGVVGSVLLFLARLPLYRQRRFWTFGPGESDRKHRQLYWLAYLFVALSLLLLGVVWVKGGS